ncbi:winged helix DNA-binding domain-containing protein [Glutamicibacter endophyticus]
MAGRTNFGAAGHRPLTGASELTTAAVQAPAARLGHMDQLLDSRRGTDRSRLRALRLRSHLLAPSTAHEPTVGAVAAHMLATQAQDLAGGAYALSLRHGSTTQRQPVVRALERGELVRSWLMRGTLHLCQSQDLGWLVRLSAPRVAQSAATRRANQHITATVVDEAAAHVMDLFRREGRASRELIQRRWQEAGLDLHDGRGYALLQELSYRLLICQGPLIDRGSWSAGQYFVPVPEVATAGVEPADPLAELLLGYLRGHGPASLRDAAWYAGHPPGALRAAAKRLGDRIQSVGTHEGEPLYLRTEDTDAPADQLAGRYLLPPFDEYYISYADRSLVADGQAQASVGPGRNGMVKASWLRSGSVLGAAGPEGLTQWQSQQWQRYQQYRAPRQD